MAAFQTSPNGGFWVSPEEYWASLQKKRLLGKRKVKKSWKLSAKWKERFMSYCCAIVTLIILDRLPILLEFFRQD